MGKLSDKFTETIQKIGMQKLERPIFYNALFGIRLEIGESDKANVYENNSEEYIGSFDYLNAAFKRVNTIFKSLPSQPNILRYDCYPDAFNGQELINSFCKIADLPPPDECKIEMVEVYYTEHETVKQMQLYWDLNLISFKPDTLFKEIIRADFGGYRELTSSVYFIDTNNLIMFYVYDDRGADLIAENKEIIYPFYDKFSDWILDYDRKKIDGIFANKA